MKWKSEPAVCEKMGECEPHGPKTEARLGAHRDVGFSGVGPDEIVRDIVEPVAPEADVPPVRRSCVVPRLVGPSRRSSGHPCFFVLRR
jgi:hypothetical protein